MSFFRRIEIFDPYYPSAFARESSFCTPKPIAFPSFLVEEEANDLIDVFSSAPDPFELFDTVTDLIEVRKTPTLCSYKRIQQRAGTELYLKTLSDRVSKLESRFDKLISSKKSSGDRKYTLTAEIKGPEERKYKWTAEIKDGKKKEKEEKKSGVAKKNYKWIAEVEGKEEEHPISRKYTFEVSSGDVDECDGSGKKDKKDKKEKKEKKDKKGEANVRLIEIQEPNDHRAVVLRQAFAKRPGVIRARKGKQTELSPHEAAALIQLTFRAYLIRRSQALRALRELAIAKAKLKEIRALFNNFSYRRQIARDAAERQRFSEKIIVLLLTVDAIEGADVMVRASKRSMVDELEAMLDVVDPQPSGKQLSMKRRTFDMPDSMIRKEIAESVAQVVQMIDQEENRTRAFEACL
ncbi:BAG family molecular chaperone regulator 7 [Euphorbia lathyris]|uniref:BAG family molecular chaperone regulator 7 n=1 Tax=Euphorbia lathyris TaxID=212925 RepID=UPI0033136C92